MSKTVRGHIDCPTCGEVGAMRVTGDKNGAPFGFCEECGAQMRIGGKPSRVRAFVARYPWAAADPAAPGTPVTVTVPEPAPAKPAPKAAPAATPPAPAPAKPAPKAAPATTPPAPAPAKKASAWFPIMGGA